MIIFKAIQIYKRKRRAINYSQLTVTIQIKLIKLKRMFHFLFLRQCLIRHKLKIITTTPTNLIRIDRCYLKAPIDWSIAKNPSAAILPPYTIDCQSAAGEPPRTPSSLNPAAQRNASSAKYVIPRIRAIFFIFIFFMLSIKFSQHVDNLFMIFILSNNQFLVKTNNIFLQIKEVHMQKQVKLLDFQLNQNKFVRFSDPIPKPSNSFFRALSISIFGNHNQVQYIKSMMKLTLLANIQKNNKKKYKDNPFPIISQNGTLLKKYDTPDKMMFWQYWQNSDRQCFQKDNYELASYTFNKKISIFSLSQDGYLNQLIISSCRKKTGQKIYLAKVGKKYFSVEKQTNVSLSGYIKDYFLKSIISKIVDQERSLKEIERQRDLMYPSYDEVVMNSHKKFPTRAHKKSLSQCGDIINKLQANELQLSGNYPQQKSMEVNINSINHNSIKINKFDSIENRSQKNESSRKKMKNGQEGKTHSPQRIKIEQNQFKNQNRKGHNQNQNQKSSPIKSLLDSSSTSKDLQFDVNSSKGNSSLIVGQSPSKSSSKSKSMNLSNTANLQKQNLQVNHMKPLQKNQTIELQIEEKITEVENNQQIYVAQDSEIQRQQNELKANQTEKIPATMNNNPYGYTAEQYAMYGGYPMQLPINHMGMNVQPNMQIPQYYPNQYAYLQQMQAMYPNYYPQMYHQEQYYVQPQQLVPNNRYRGRLKFFQINNKYGFIVVDGINIDLFVHYDDLSKAGITKQKLQGHNNRQMRFQFTYYEYDGKHKKSKKAVDLVLLAEG